jgi:Tfp pilus assembly protein PilP
MCGGARAQQAPAAPPTTAPRPVGLAVPPPNGVATPAYERKGRRDPFQPVESLQPEMTSPTVASARLKGIVRGSAPRALIETPDGIGYIMKVGDTLAEGRLIEIGADRVVFSVPARRGSTTHRIVLRLPDD